VAISISHHLALAFNCHCEGGGWIIVKFLVLIRGTPPWQSLFKAKGRRQEARVGERLIAIARASCHKLKSKLKPPNPNSCLLQECLLPSSMRLLRLI
jgi:hypothetical protein